MQSHHTHLNKSVSTQVSSLHGSQKVQIQKIYSDKKDYQSPPNLKQKQSDLTINSSQCQKSIKSQWTKQDEQMLYNLYIVDGSKWSSIALKMGKDRKILKNRFHGGLRKLHRRLVNTGKKMSPTKRILTYQALIRPLDASNFPYEPFQNFHQQCEDLKKQIISSIKNCSQFFNEQDAKNLLNRIHRFNSLTKSFKFDKYEDGKKIDKSLDAQKYSYKSEDNNKIYGFQSQIKYAQKNQNSSLSQMMLHHEDIERLFQQSKCKYTMSKKFQFEHNRHQDKFFQIYSLKDIISWECL